MQEDRLAADAPNLVHHSLPAGIVQIGVSMTPGWTVLTRIPSDSTAHSIATALANSRTPPFVAQ
ncbi:MAG: hypothetical protein WBX30_34490 [Stellaceae bacterium]